MEELELFSYVQEEEEEACQQFPAVGWKLNLCGPVGGSYASS